MVFVIQGIGGRQAYSSNQDPSKAAKLCLSWEMPSTFHGGGVDRSVTDGGIRATLYPNPNRGEVVYMNLNNDFQETTNGKVVITDIYGKDIYTKNIIVNAGLHQEILELQGSMAQGVYLVNVLVDGRMITERLVIQ